MTTAIKKPTKLRLGSLLGLLLLTLAGCAGFDPFNHEASPQDRFIQRITGSVWYQEFRNAHTRPPRIAVTAAPGFRTKRLVEALKKHPKILTVTNSAPDFTLHIRPDSQAELLDPGKNIVWLVETEGAVGAAPVAKPVVLWRGFYLGPRVGVTDFSGSVIQGSTFMGEGVRLGYSFTNLGDISAYMPQISYDRLGAPSISIPLGGTSTTLTGSVGLSDIMADPLRFGFPLFSDSTLLSVGVGAGDLMLTGGLSSTFNPEAHFSIDLEYRLFEHWAPYLEFVFEEAFLSSSTNATYSVGPVSYSTPISQFGSSTSASLIRFMVGVDWFPWITKSNVSEAGGP